MNLYPAQSNSVKSLATNQGIKIPKTTINSLQNGSKIKIRFKHKVSEITPGYLFGRENPTPVPSTSDYGTSAFYYTSGGLAYSFYWMGSAPGACIIPASSLQDGNLYLATLNIDATLSFKMNKITRVNNQIVYGTDINSTTTAKGVTAPDIDLGVLCGNYVAAMGAGSKHQVIDFEILDHNGNCVCYIPFSEGAGNKITDVCSGNQYTLNNISDVDLPTFWQPKQDINFHNFYYGFTLYQKSGSADIRIPNTKNGVEIIPAAVPSGYSKTANYKNCKNNFNFCENLFKLDDVNAGSTDLTLSGWGDSDLNGNVYVYDVYEGKNRYINNTISDYTRFIVWQSGEWKIGVAGGIVKWTSNEDVPTPDLVENWTVFGTGTEPAGTISAQSPSDFFTADIDRIFFNTDGTAKEFDIKDLKIDFGIDRGHLYIKEVTFIDFMIYAADKTLAKDVEILKFFGLGSRIQTIDGEIQYIDGHAVYI